MLLAEEAGSMPETTQQAERRPMRRRGAYANGQQTREEFTAKALELFAAQGFQRLSLRKIAEALGVSHAALTYHFPTKESLLEAVFNEQAMREAPVFEPMIEERGILDALPDLLSANDDIPDLIQLDVTILAEAIRPDHSAHMWAQERMDAMVQDVKTGLALEREKGRLRSDIDLDVTARQISAMVRGLQLQWLYRRDTPRVDDIREFLELLRP